MNHRHTCTHSYMKKSNHIPSTANIMIAAGVSMIIATVIPTTGAITHQTILIMRYDFNSTRSHSHLQK